MFWLVAIVLSGCIKIEEPEFRQITDFHIAPPSPAGVKTGFTMVYHNPNRFSVTVKETAVNVYVEGMYLGEFLQDSLVEVKQNAAFMIPLSGELSLATLLNNDLRKLLKRQVLIKAEGATKIGKAGIFIEKAIHYQGRHRLDTAGLP